VQAIASGSRLGQLKRITTKDTNFAVKTLNAKNAKESQSSQRTEQDGVPPLVQGAIILSLTAFHAN
jgi:hypothetical protein